MTEVVNIRRDKEKVAQAQAEGRYVAIHRPHKFGNPFTHLDGRTHAKFKVATRAEAIAAYARWIQTQPELLAALPELKGKVLGCWCRPLSCHGQILARLADGPEAEQLLLRV